MLSIATYSGRVIMFDLTYQANYQKDKQFGAGTPTAILAAKGMLIIASTQHDEILLTLADSNLTVIGKCRLKQFTTFIKTMRMVDVEVRGKRRHILVCAPYSQTDSPLAFYDVSVDGILLILVKTM